MNCGRKLMRPLFETVCFGVGALIFSLSLRGSAAAQTWIELFPIGGPPDAVLAHGAMSFGYDAATNRLIVYFPSNPGVSSGLSSEVWVLTNANGLGGTPAWVKLTPGGSPPDNINVLNSAVYDATTNRLIVYGGCFSACSPAQSTVYVLTNANGLGGPPMWAQSSVTNPQARVGHSTVYDSAGNRMITFGGGLAFFGTDQNDTRILSAANGLTGPSTWTALSTSGGLPGIREEHRAVYDEANNRMTIFGGTNLITFCCPYAESNYNDVWVLSNANGQAGTPTWTQLSPPGSLPDPRYRHSAVYDSTNNRMIAFGGIRWNQATQNYTVLSDLWQLSNANGLGGTPTWAKLTPLGTGPGPNWGQAVAFDTVNQRMIVFGGGGGSDAYALTSFHKRVWVLDFAPPKCVTPPSGLVSWWPGEGNADDIIGGNYGTLHNGTTFAAGVVGQALSFDGVDDYAALPNNILTGSRQLTIDAWINVTNTSTTKYIYMRCGLSGVCGQSASDQFYVQADTLKVVLDLGSTQGRWSAITTNPISENTWHHVAGVYDSTLPIAQKVKIYVDGQLASDPGIEVYAGDEALGPNQEYISGPQLTGQISNGGRFKGLIDELEIYNHALSASEIAASFNAGSAGKCRNRAPVAMCQNVTVSAGPNCLANASIDNGSFDPDGDPITLTQSPPGPYPMGSTLVTLTVTDSQGASSQCTATVTVTNPSPAVTITGPPGGAVYAAGTPVSFTGTFTDTGDIHTANWMFDSLTLPGTVDESTGAVSTTYTFATAGVYLVTLAVSDSCGAIGTANTVNGLTAMVVIYDPSGGFVTGGGWINSPPGAYSADPSLTGKANFGFVSKYQPGATTPTGQTEFQFRAAGLNLRSSSYDWLVVAGARAQFKGSGMINGGGNYGFLLTAIDGQVNGGGGADKFRLKVWDKGTGNIIYDNQAGAGDSANPITPLGGGSIIIHK